MLYILYLCIVYMCSMRRTCMLASKWQPSL